MNKEKVCQALAGLNDGFKVLESGTELKAQTGRLRNLLNAADIDTVLGNTIVAIRELNAALQEGLNEE